MQKGNIGVTTDNIFPIIKKFLYSDHEIFLREIVSNAVDATQKLKTLSSVGDFKGELGELFVEVKVNKDAGTLTISDRGIGMTEEDLSNLYTKFQRFDLDKNINNVSTVKYKVTATNLHVRKGPGTSNAVVTTIKKNHAFYLLYNVL